MAALKVGGELLKQTFEEKILINYLESFDKIMLLPHFHDEYEISFIMTDNITYNVGAKSYLLKNSSIAVFNETDIHMANAPQNDLPLDIINIHFNPKFIQDLCVSHPELTEQFTSRNSDFQHCILLNNIQSENMLILLHKMLDCYRNKNINSHELRIKLILCEILLYINEIYDVNKINLPIKNYAYKEQLYTAMEYIKANLSEDLSLNSLASKMFMSQQTLIKYFKTVGLTPNQYIIYCRIMKSKEYLKQGFPMYKVCELVGYTNISSFIRTFKKIVGYTPKNYALQFAQITAKKTDKSTEQDISAVYTEELKKEALKLAGEIGETLAAKKLGIPKATLLYWVKA